VLAADRTRIFEFAHGWRESIPHSRTVGNVVFQSFNAKAQKQKPSLRLGVFASLR
jgi:hypothetical protein